MTNTLSLDDHSRRILQLLQKDATLTVDQISQQVGLSRSPVWNRIREMEQAGVIKGRVALVDPKALGFGQTVYVTITTQRHDTEWLAEFSSLVQKIPEVVSFYRMAGELDYMLKVLVRDVGDYDRIYKRLIELRGLNTVSAHFAMEEIKSTTEVPV
ncbi:MAG: Lrp/AsnC family transcriptional regulator, partial [Pseudomonadota bacterium]